MSLSLVHLISHSPDAAIEVLAVFISGNLSGFAAAAVYWLKWERG